MDKVINNSFFYFHEDRFEILYCAKYNVIITSLKNDISKAIDNNSIQTLIDDFLSTKNNLSLIKPNNLYLSYSIDSLDQIIDPVLFLDRTYYDFSSIEIFINSSKMSFNDLNEKIITSFCNIKSKKSNFIIKWDFSNTKFDLNHKVKVDFKEYLLVLGLNFKQLNRSNKINIKGFNEFKNSINVRYLNEIELSKSNFKTNSSKLFFNIQSISNTKFDETLKLESIFYKFQISEFIYKFITNQLFFISTPNIFFVKNGKLFPNLNIEKCESCWVKSVCWNTKVYSIYYELPELVSKNDLICDFIRYYITIILKQAAKKIINENNLFETDTLSFKNYIIKRLN